MSTTLNRRLADETHPAGGELLQAAVNSGEDSEIARKHSNTGNILNRQATF